MTLALTTPRLKTERLILRGHAARDMDTSLRYMTEAARAVRNHAYGALGLITLVSYFDRENTRSIAVADRLGCTRDPQAAIPDIPGWKDALVYRHPGPEAQS